MLGQIADRVAAVHRNLPGYRFGKGDAAFRSAAPRQFDTGASEKVDGGGCPFQERGFGEYWTEGATPGGYEIQKGGLSRAPGADDGHETRVELKDRTGDPRRVSCPNLIDML